MNIPVNNSAVSSWKLRLIYAAPQTSISMLWIPVYVLQGVYAKYYGISMTSIAIVVLLSRIFDALIDPIVGDLSDRYKEKTGLRKPLIAFGACFFVISSILLYVPPFQPTLIYFALSLSVFFVGLTCVFIPYLAWGGELAVTSHEKTALFAANVAAGYVGLAIFYSIPILPFFETAEITPETMKWAAIFAVGFLLISLPICLYLVPEASSGAIAPKKSYVSVNLWKRLKSIFSNQPFNILLISYFLASTGLGVWYGMIFLYVDVYLLMGEHFAFLYLIAFCCGVFSTLLWERLSKLIGKKRTWTLSLVLGLLAISSTGLLNSTNSTVVNLAFLLVATTAVLVCNDLLPRSILSDIIDYATLKDGHSQGASYFSTYMFFAKAAFAVGGALGFASAGAFGFDPSSTVQTEYAEYGIFFTMVVIPASFLLAAIFISRCIPIDEGKHRIIRKRLDLVMSKNIIGERPT